MKNKLKTRLHIDGTFMFLFLLLANPGTLAWGLDTSGLLPGDPGAGPGRVVQQPLRAVSGKVTDIQGQPLPGVSIAIKGTTTGTITGFDGNYTLNNISADAILVFSFVGMKSQEIPVTGRTAINVRLEEETIGLEEVVAIGYGTMKKADVTSAVSSVKTDDFIKGSVKDVGQLIQGKVAGLAVTSSSGDPTSNVSISLRGRTTLYGTSTDPLILIDGVPGDFNSVAPEDVESFDVLKDGSAAAIYGSRATNGVIIITTKRAGRQYHSSVEYTAYTSTQTIYKELDVCTATDYRELIREGIRSESDDLGASTDWLDKITRTPVSQEHNLTFRGGNGSTNYLASINYNDTKGIFLKSNKETFTVRSDINHTMFDGLIKLNLGVLSRNIHYTTTGDGYSFNGYTYRQALIYNPTAPVKNEDGSWYENTGNFNYDNPLARLKESNGKNKDQWTRINGTILITPLKGLSLKALLSYSKYNQTRGYYETKNHISTKRSGLNGYASKGGKESIDKLAELTAEYNDTFGKHHFTVLGGYSYSENDYQNYYMTNTDFPTDIFTYNDIGLGNGILEEDPYAGIFSERSKTNLIGFFGRATYNYDEKYLLMGSLRYEGASQLWGTDDKWGLFPAISLGWRISNEPFMESLGFIDNLKLRAGYGVTGSQPSDSFLGVSTLAYSSYFYTDGKWIQTLAPARNDNPYLRWEKKKETNIGLDFSLLKNRISGNIDAYHRKIDGLLYDYTVPMPPNLVSTTTANVGVMTNNGIEVLLNFVPVSINDFQWTTSVNFSTNKNKLKSLSNELYEASRDYFTDGSTGEPIQTYTHRVDVGGKIGNFYGFKVVDVNEDGKWVYLDAEGNHVNYDDFNHAEEDKQVLGNGVPKYYAGWNNTFRYKNFDLSITMRGAFHYQILNFERMYLENPKISEYNRLKSAYDKVFGKAMLSSDCDLEYNSYYIEDGDYWKIDNITLGYNFPRLNNKYVKSIRIYGSVLNALTITGYDGIDPEVTVTGLTPGNDYRDKYPTTRTYTLGINVGF
ncbi:MAG: SusC/RagA family TonB-linked outer membrane protein [Mangrovibacterium sp.]